MSVVETRTIAIIVPDSEPVRAILAIVVIAAVGGTALAQTIPLPRERPKPASWEVVSWPDAPPDLAAVDLTSEPSDCRQRLDDIAVVTPLPRLIGPGECGGSDMVRLEAVLLPDQSRVEILPAPVLRCRMAESVAGWVRDEVAPGLRSLGSLRSVENYDGYDCRGRNRVSTGKVSEHGKGNALDVRFLTFADGRAIFPTDPTVAKDVREMLRTTACSRFTTVLGTGADGHHESHIHLDLAERGGGRRLCQWELREPSPAGANIASASVPLPPLRPVRLGQEPNHDSRL